MSLMDLIDACYTFPLAFDIFLCEDELAATDYYIENFNGLKKLSEQENVIGQLIDYYATISPKNVQQQYREAYLERLLNSKTFFSKLSVREAQRLATIMADKQETRSRLYADSLIGQQRFESLKNAVSHFTLPASIRYTDSYHSGSFTTQIVYTPFLQSITANVYDDTIPWYERDFNENYLNQFYSYVTIVSVDSTIYNSHAYALKGSKYYTIEDPLDVAKFFTNDLYTSCLENEAELIHYYAGDHTADRYNSNSYISKWNEALVIHGPHQVPPAYQSNCRNFYKIPTISGPDYLVVGQTYYYTVSPYMSYASYNWYIDQNEERYQIISINDNVLQVKFLTNAIFDVYCDVCNSSGYHALTLMYETLY